MKFKSVKSRGGGWFSSTLEGALKVDVTSSGVQRVSVGARSEGEPERDENTLGD